MKKKIIIKIETIFKLCATLVSIGSVRQKKKLHLFVQHRRGIAAAAEQLSAYSTSASLPLEEALGFYLY